MLTPFYQTLLPLLPEAPKMEISGQTSITGLGFYGSGMPEIGLHSFPDLLNWFKARVPYDKRRHNATEFLYIFKMDATDLTVVGYKEKGMRKWTISFSLDKPLSAHDRFAYLEHINRLFSL